MKKLLLLALSACFMTAIAVAQETKTTKQEEQKEWDNKVKTELKLTQDQIVKYDAVSKEYGEKMETLKKDASVTPEAQKEKKMELRKEKQAKLFEFFTPEQQTKYLEMVEKKMKEMKAAKPEGQ
jgi:Spy/CpxP family protein refolding chaperone